MTATAHVITANDTKSTADVKTVGCYMDFATVNGVCGRWDASTFLQASPHDVDQTEMPVAKPLRGCSWLSRTAFVLALCPLAACGSAQPTAKPASTECASVDQCLRLTAPIEPHIKVMTPRAAGLVFEAGSVAATNAAQPFLTISYREPTRRLRLRLAVFDHVTTSCPPNQVETNVTSPAGRSVCLAIFPKQVGARFANDGLLYVLSVTGYPAPIEHKRAALDLRPHVLRIVDSCR